MNSAKHHICKTVTDIQQWFLPLGFYHSCHLIFFLPNLSFRQQHPLWPIFINKSTFHVNRSNLAILIFSDTCFEMNGKEWKGTTYRSADREVKYNTMFTHTKNSVCIRGGNSFRDLRQIKALPCSAGGSASKLCHKWVLPYCSWIYYSVNLPTISFKSVFFYDIAQSEL